MAKSKTRKKDGEAVTVLRFSDEHLWVRAESDGVQIGISDHGQNGIGEVIAVELPEIGDSIEKGEPFGELESVRTVHELIAPVSGTVRAVNGDLEDHASLANEDPYHDGWLIEVELSDEDELEELMATEDYEEFVAGDEDA
ncbi:MAG: glycine cleavage system protein GcvH [bacterium]